MFQQPTTMRTWLSSGAIHVLLIFIWANLCDSLAIFRSANRWHGENPTIHPNRCEPTIGGATILATPLVPAEEYFSHKIFRWPTDKTVWIKGFSVLSII